MPDAFRKVVAEVDPFFVHGVERVGRDASGRGQPGAGGDKHVAAVRAGEALRHLATAGIANTDKKYSLQRRAHSFSKKYRWTRASLVSSGWKVDTRCFPCSTSTGSPLYRARMRASPCTSRMMGARM